MHRLQPSASVTFPEAFATSYSPMTDHLLTIDSTGRTLFGVTQSGITMMVLNTVPLSIGNLQPAFVQPQGGQVLTVRGSGFQLGAAVTINALQINATFVDENTLTVQVPALASGWWDVTVALPNGTTYTTPGLLQVIAPQTAPVVTGFTPTSIAVQSNIPGFDTTATVTVLGSGFALRHSRDQWAASQRRIHRCWTYPGNDSCESDRSGGFSLHCGDPPYSGSSNPVALPMINPVPTLQGNPPITEVPGSGTGLTLYGIGFVAGSTIQWNGQNLSTNLNGGETSTRLESVFALIPAGLTTQAGSAILTVSNPGPGGGISNAISVDVSPAHPVLFLRLVNPKNNTSTPFDTFPTSMDLGTTSLVIRHPSRWLYRMWAQEAITSRPRLSHQGLSRSKVSFAHQFQRTANPAVRKR